MNCYRRAGVALFFLGNFWFATGQAQTLDQTGVHLLWACTTNLNGQGIKVAQPEADVSVNPLAFEINPADVGVAPAIFSYSDYLGISYTYPNGLGTNSWHAENVAVLFYGPNEGVATNVAHVDNSDANYFVTNYIFNPRQPNLGDAVVNQSFTFGNVTNTDNPPANYITILEQQEIDSIYDDYASSNQTLFVSAVNNQGTVSPPGTTYNGIGVGCYGVGANSSVGPTLDNGRCKPDITAPAGATSFSTPLVAGAAAVLLQAGERGDGGSDTNSVTDMRTIKALLLNGAVKPIGWTNGSDAPLDARYGAGMLNLFNAYYQLAGGKQSYVVATGVALGTAHPPTSDLGTVSTLNGWDFNTNTSCAGSDRVNHYYFNVTNGAVAANYTATATLVWNRQLGQTDINNLGLFLYQVANSNLVACSTSWVDNVQHIYQPQLSPGRYDLQVWKAGGTNVVSTNEVYALAFAFVPTLTLAITSTGSNIALSWPAYPAGYALEMATNILRETTWTTNNLPSPAISHLQNMLVLPATNTSQFFRLASPDF